MHPVAPEQGHYQHEQQDPQYSDTPAFLRTARQHDPSRYDDVLYDQNSQNHPQYADTQYQDGYQDHPIPMLSVRTMRTNRRKNRSASAAA